MDPKPPDSPGPTQEQPVQPENPFRLQTELKNQIEILVADRAGAPIYEMIKTDEETRLSADTTGSTDRPTMTITKNESQLTRRVYGVILPAEVQNQWILLGIDGSAILCEDISKKTPALGDFVESYYRPNGNGRSIQPDHPMTRHLSFARQALWDSHTRVISDIEDNPTEMITVINRAIDRAAEQAKKRRENMQNALPQVVDALKRYGITPSVVPPVQSPPPESPQELPPSSQ